jgi:hypothetical protein
VDNAKKRKFLILPGIELLLLGRSPRSQSLYTLCIVLIPPVIALRLGSDILLSIFFSYVINPFCSFKVNTIYI